MIRDFLGFDKKQLMMAIGLVVLTALANLRQKSKHPYFLLIPS